MTHRDSSRFSFCARAAAYAAVLLILLMPTAGISAQGQGLSVNFAPYYLEGMDPEFSSPVSEAQMLAALDAVAPYCDTIRTFGVTGALYGLYQPAKETYDFRIIVGCWIGKGYTDEQAMQELQALADIANAGWADILLVGSEGLFRADYSAAALIGWMDTLRTMLDAPLPVGTSDTAGALLANADVIAASDIVCYTYYPYHNGTDIAHALADFASMHEKMLTAAQGKPLLCSETGWPDAGEPKGKAVPSAENAARYLDEICAYAREYTFEVCYFEAITEPWKGKYGIAEKSYGLLDSDLKPKAHYEALLSDIESNRRDEP